MYRVGSTWYLVLVGATLLRAHRIRTVIPIATVDGSHDGINGHATSNLAVEHLGFERSQVNV